MVGAMENLISYFLLVPHVRHPARLAVLPV